MIKLTAPTTTDNSFKKKKKKKKKKRNSKQNIYIFFIVYELSKWSQDLNSDFTVKDCLFGSDVLAKNARPDKYVYSD